MSFKYVVYEDPEGRWVCPVDERKKSIYVKTRYDAQSFFNMWKEGCIISIDSPGSLGDLSQNKEMK